MTATQSERAQPLILVVEDEESLRLTIEYNLRQQGYRVTGTGRGDEAVRIAARDKPDLVILDLMLPGLDGIQVCRTLRRRSPARIILLTALAGEADRVTGLDAGADDYVPKPFGMRELMARVRAQLRRRSTPHAPQDNDELHAGDLTIDLARHEVRRGENIIHLRPREFGLLLFFARNAGHVLSREQILASVWGESHRGTERTVDVHVRWLREKLAGGARDSARIVTVRGSGYLFEL